MNKDRTGLELHTQVRRGPKIARRSACLGIGAGRNTIVATNPGPVHSKRIYKTVYPKAAVEFLEGAIQALPRPR